MKMVTSIEAKVLSQAPDKALEFCAINKKMRSTVDIGRITSTTVKVD